MIMSAWIIKCRLIVPYKLNNEMIIRYFDELVDVLPI